MQRWLRMAKYFEEFGWDLVVFTPQNPEKPVVDNSLFSQVRASQRIVKHPIWEPYMAYRFIAGRKQESRFSAFINEKKNPGFAQSLALQLRANVFIPDPRRLWVRPASRRLIAELMSLEADALISTGPPHSMHLIGMKVAKNRSLPWIADFRDPWTGIHYFSKLPLTRVARALHKRLERRVLCDASKVVTVSTTWAKELSDLSGRPVSVIPNGYDHSDFPPGVNAVEPFLIRYFGSMVPTRNPRVLWQALAELKSEGHVLVPEVRVELYGSIDRSVVDSAADFGVGAQVTKKDYIPNAEALKLMKKSDLLLVTINQGPGARGMIPGKLYECMASKRPVLLLGPADGDAAVLVQKFDAGWVADHQDVKKVKQGLADWLTGRASKWDEEQKSNMSNQAYRFTGGTEQSQIAFKSYSRRELARNYCSLLDELHENTQV